jgi:signal transduction histidine kinase
MFESARLKLTLFYLAILLAFSLLLTWGLRALVQIEFKRINEAQRGAVHDIGLEYFGPTLPRQSDRDFAQVQTSQQHLTQVRLNQETAILNLGVLVVGGALSYWYAGRTLKPIQEAHERQKRFTADASHELRTPLASMRLENEVFLRQPDFNEAEARSQITSNLEEVARLEGLTARLLDLNNYENVQLKPQKLDTRALVNEAIERFQAAAPESGVSFRNGAAKATALGDRESLLQLIGILLDNAVKYGPPKGKVEILGELRGDAYALAVRDHGGGIAEADLPHIFERMYRGDKARSHAVSGYGIGLSLAKQIAEANGATLEASNHPKGGAVFTLTLPKG